MKRVRMQYVSGWRCVECGQVYAQKPPQRFECLDCGGSSFSDLTPAWRRDDSDDGVRLGANGQIIRSGRGE